jgi:plasmid stabilization system protein ParE
VTLGGPKALADLDGLLKHYEKLGRPEASRNLLAALERAKTKIAEAPEAGLTAPRPYPELKRAGRRWLREGSYWISYSMTDPPVISGVFYVTANIPKRL